MDVSKGMNKRLRKTSLLERVRQGLVTTNLTTDEEKCQFNRLIVEHQSEFPSNIRPAIIGAAVYAEKRFDHFECVLFEAVVTALAGLPFRGQLQMYVYDNVPTEEEVELIRDQWRRDRVMFATEEWNGLNSDVDTEEEVELMIRCFSFISRCFFSFLTCSAKSVFFVPLCIEVGHELGWLSNDAWLDVLEELVNKSEGPSAELDEKSLAVLIRLKEKGLVKKGCECKLICWLLYSLHNERSISFIETRLRLLIAWNPITLRFRSYPHTQYPSLYLFLNEFVEIKNEAPNFRIFEVLIELGMTHYPTKLGCVFFENNFGSACKIFGAHRVTQLIEDKLLSFLNQINGNKALALRALVLAAAIDDDISIDGVYTLLRYDPIASLTKSST